MKKAEITVQLIDYMGSDVSVVNAARISFDKIKDEFAEKLAECIKECYPVCWKVLTKE